MDRKEERGKRKEIYRNLKFRLFPLHYSLFAIFFLFTLYSSLFTPSPVFSQVCPTPPPGISGCICNASNILECRAAGIIQLQQVLTRIINISVTIAFMALTVWLVWSALKFFITSGGDPKALSHAWGSVTWAFMGLFFMVLAYLILKLIFAVTGADVTKYCLGFPPYCL